MGAAHPFIAAIRLLGVVAVLLFVLQGAAADESSLEPIVGNEAVEPTSDYTPEGKAEAFQTLASKSGSVRELRLYVDEANEASRIVIGLYTNSSGHPRGLLAKGELSSPSAGWNTVEVTPTDVTAGETYWIAVLGPVGAGKPYVRNRCCDSGTSRVRGSSDAALTDLPGEWSSGGWSMMNGPFSAYGVAELAPSAPAPTPPAPAAPQGSAADTSPPTMPGNLRVKRTTGTEIVISWKSATDNVGVTLYRIFRDGVFVGEETAGTWRGSQNQWTDGRPVCGTTHAYGIEAQDAAGNLGPRALLSASTAPCNDPPPPTLPQCSDTKDNDADGKVDLADPGCANASDNDESDPSPSPQCSDTKDNDADGKVDLADPGCANASDNDESDPSPSPLCSDTKDNDADGKVDLADPGCANASDNDESDPSPSPLCSDTKDNDADGKVDLADPGCANASDNDESDPPPPVDTQAPTTPRNLRTTAATTATLTIAWDASTDNVRVAGYAVYRNATELPLGVTTALSYTISGLQCGRGYTFSVDAFDAADNRSGLATVTTSTLPCPTPVGTVLPGQSWDAACSAASPGDVIFVAPGAHSSQTFTCNKAAPGVFFRPTPGAANDSVRVGYIDTATTNDADGISIEGDAFYLGGFHVRNNSERWTFRDVHVHGNVHISSASSISIIGGEIERAGDVLSSDPQIKKASGGVQPSNILIDGVNWHDFAVREAGAHIECLQIMAGNGITIRNSRFFGCSTQGVFINQALEGVISNLLVENNWFGPTVEGYNSLIVGTVSGSATVRHNSFAGQAPRASSPTTWIGNTGVLGSCHSGSSYSYNVWTSVACSGSDLKAPVAWVNESGRNLHLRSGSAAIDRVTTGSVGRDIDGQSRPMGGARDAGADEAM